MAQGGDFTDHNGRGGASIYGDKFDDENFINKHTGRGILSMANSGKNTNGSQFFLCFKDTPHLNKKHVVFGKVVSGMGILNIMEHSAVGANDKPRKPIVIKDCGQVEEEPVAATIASESAPEENKTAAKVSSDSTAKAEPSSVPKSKNSNILIEEVSSNETLDKNWW